MHYRINIKKARAQLTRLVRIASEKDIIITQNGKPVAAIVSFTAYVKTLTLIEDLEDEIAFLEANHDTSVPFMRSDYS